MKAILIPEVGGPEVMRYQELPEPTPGEGQVLIRTAMCGVNYADVKIRTGKYHSAKPPVVPGLDVAGVIAAVGPGVTSHQVGQRVAALCGVGGYAEYVVASAELTWPIPDEVDWEAGAAFPTIAITAYNLLTMCGRLAPGESVLVHSAAGGVGVTAVQLAKLLGAGTVIGTVGSDAKADVARSVGCDHVINYRNGGFAQRVQELTGGAGCDMILDAVGGSMFAEGLTCMAPFGRMVVYGEAGGEQAGVTPGQLYSTNRSVIGYSTGARVRRAPQSLRPAAEAVISYLKEGRLSMLVGARFPLAEAAEAHRLIESRESTGKILLKP